MLEGAQVAGIAQLVEHLICNQGVAGSNPAAGTTYFLRKINKIRVSALSQHFVIFVRRSTEHVNRTVTQSDTD